MYCHYRGLNKITHKDYYPLLYIDDLVDRLHTSRSFTKLHLASGYLQLRIHKKDHHKTALITLRGRYEWKVKLFGLMKAPAAFMRTMNHTICTHSRYTIVYLNNIVVHSKTRSKHTQYVDAVFQSIRRA
jgi:hypothetical protein